ncbi:MAG TPA: hypothetical protein VF475_08935 [Sphingobium sp.]
MMGYVDDRGYLFWEGRLTDFLKPRFASFKVPREILFFAEEDLAVTGSGKVKFQQMRDIATRKLAERVAG